MRNRVSFLIISVIVIIFLLIINFSNLTPSNHRTDASHSSYSPATASTFNNLVPSTSHTTSLPEGFTSIGNDLSIYTTKTKETSEFGFIEVEKKSFNQPSKEYFEQLEAAISEEVEYAKSELSLSDDTYNFLNQNLKSGLGETQFPTSFDLRNVNSTNYITGVVNQGSYGVCWAFAIVNSLETSAFVNNMTESLTPFSQVHLVNSVFNNWTYSINTGAYTMGNLGGNAYSGPAGIQKGFSPQLESSYPYSQANQTLNLKVSPWDETTLNQHIGNLSNITYLPDIVDLEDTSETVNESYTYHTNQTSIEAVKLSLTQLKPVFIGFNASGTGCPSSGTNCFNGSQSFSANHAVSIVGWNDDYSKDNFSDNGEKPPADGAFIVKNSWGSSWGNSGYFYLSYYDQSIQQLSTFELTDLSNYTFDSYSDVGWDYTVLNVGNSTTITYANVFWNDDFATSENQLYGVQFYSEDAEETDHIQIYLDNSASNDSGLIPTSGSLVYEFTYTPGFSGMNTIFFDESIQLNANSNYSVVITVEVPESHFATAPIENPGAYVGDDISIVNANTNLGQSYYYFPGYNWVDVVSTSVSVDFLIKGIRSTAGQTTPDNIITQPSISISPTPSPILSPTLSNSPSPTSSLSESPTLSPTPSISPSPTPSETSTTETVLFDDLDNLSESRIEAIIWLQNSRITSGCDSSGRLYCPNTTVNRGSMAQFLYKLATYINRSDDNLNPKPNFSDTKTLSSSRSQAIDWLYQEGITGGCNTAGTKFCPNEPVNRGSMAIFLQKFAKIVNTPTQSSYFADVKSGSGTFKIKYQNATKSISVNKISAQRVAAINWLYSTQISAGSGSINNQVVFRPQDSVNRGSMASFIKKLADYMK